MEGQEGEDEEGVAAPIWNRIRGSFSKYASLPLRGAVRRGQTNSTISASFMHVDIEAFRNWRFDNT
jgi:hypothetical protein